MKFIKTYDSGLKVVAENMPHLYTVSFGVYVNVGSSFENENQNGYCHLIEHMNFKGTKTRTALEIMEQMENLGAQVNAYTTKDSTCFYFKCFEDDFELCAEMLADMYFNSTFNEKELEAEKRVVIEEIAEIEDLHDEKCFELASQAIFADQKLGMPIGGTEENVSKATRQHLLDFKNKYYCAQNTIISVAGKVDQEKLDAIIKKYFESNFVNNQGQYYFEQATDYSSKFLYKICDSEQSHLCYAYPTFPSMHENTPQTAVLSYILGGGMTSRLFQSVREKHGLAYSVYAFRSAYRNAGYLQIYAAINSENVLKTNKLIKKEINLLLKDGVTQQELDRAKAQLIKSFYMSLEGNNGVMPINGRRLLKTGQLIDVEHEVNLIKAITVDDVNKLAQEIFTQNYALAYVGKSFEGIDSLK